MSIVQIKLLGGLGNCLFQYVCARKYAQIHGATLEIQPGWAGREIFALADPVWARDLPERNDMDTMPGGDHCGEVDIRLGGYFQFQDWIGLLSRQELKKWLQIDPKWQALVPQRASPRLAAHIRRGDYGAPYFCEVSEESYLLACERFGLQKDRILWVRQDIPGLLPGIPASFSYLTDFINLVRANTLLRANSTFSWWAATLSNAEVYSPVTEGLVGPNTVPFVKGNHPRCSDSSRVGVRVTDLYLPK